MKTFWVELTGFPLGGYALIVANDRAHAQRLLIKSLENHDDSYAGMEDHIPLKEKVRLYPLEMFEEIKMTWGVKKLWDGDY